MGDLSEMDEMGKGLFLRGMNVCTTLFFGMACYSCWVDGLIDCWSVSVPPMYPPDI